MKIRFLIISAILILSSCTNREEASKVSSSYFRTESVNKITFVEHKGKDFHIPIVEFEFRSYKVHFIIDSGSNISVIDKLWCEKNKEYFELKKEELIEYVNISGSDIIKTYYVKGRINNLEILLLTSNLGKIQKVTNKYNLNIIGILGSNFLNSEGYTIDYANKIMIKQ